MLNRLATSDIHDKYALKLPTEVLWTVSSSSENRCGTLRYLTLTRGSSAHRLMTSQHLNSRDDWRSTVNYVSRRYRFVAEHRVLTALDTPPCLTLPPHSAVQDRPHSAGSLPDRVQLVCDAGAQIRRWMRKLERRMRATDNIISPAYARGS